MTRSSVGNALLDHLGDMENALLEACFTSRYLERDTVIDEPGDRIETVFLPTGAILSVITLMEDGRGVESSTIGRESAYGVLSAFGSHNAHNRVVVQVAGPCLMMSTTRLKEAAQRSPILADDLIRHVQCNMAQIEQSVACNALHSVEERLCR